MDKPKVLYKYETINEYSLRNLKNASLYFNAPVSFNDPFDCSLLKESISYKPEDIVRLFNEYIKRARPSGYSRAANIDDVPSDFKRQVDRALNTTVEEKQKEYLYNIGCTCFSNTNKHILMWSHYAQGHRGICLEFDTSCEPFDKVFDVSYSKEYPKLNPIDLVLNNSSFDRNSLSPLLTKYECWKYEEEWRAFHKEPNKIYTYPVDALKAVYFGIATEMTDIEIVCLILLGQSPKIKFNRASKSKAKYEVNFSEFTYTPYRDTI